MMNTPEEEPKEPLERPGGPPDSVSESESEFELRELFRRSAPISTPLDMDSLMSAAVRRDTLKARRSSWKLLAAALVLLSLGAGLGWATARNEAQKQAGRIRETLAVDLEKFQLELAGEVIGALRHSRESLWEAQQDEIKRLAILLRNDYRGRLAGLQSEVRELASTIAERAHLRFAGLPVNFDHLELGTEER